MSNKSTGRARGSRPVPKEGGRTPIVPIVIGVIVLLAVIAVVASSGGDDDGGGDVAAGIEQNRPVSVRNEVLPRFESAGTDAAVGREAPVLTGQTFAGDPITVPTAGKPTVVVFVAHWCPHCQAEIPRIGPFLEANPRNDVDVLTVSTGVARQQGNYPPSAWLEREGWPAPTLADDEEGTAGNVYGLASYPYFVAIDAQGRVVARTSGEIGTERFEALRDAAVRGSAGG